MALNVTQVSRNLPMTADESQMRLIVQLRKSLSETADSFVGSVAYDVVSQILLEEFISAAHRQLLSNCQERVTQSKIGLWTGISPESVRKVLNQVQDEVPPLTVQERILELWRSDPEYTNDAREPVRLLILGGRDTFQGLVNRVVRGVTPQTALDALIESNSILVVDRHWVEIAN